MAGADKRIELSPAGGLGLLDRAAKFLIRFDELETATRPQDETGVCEEFDVTLTTAPTVMPSKVAAALGRGRLFNGATMAIASRDREPGATLLTRDMSIQVVLTWDAVAQAAAAIPGTIISRGVGGSAAEYVGYGLRIDAVDPSTFTGLIRWYWQDVAGVERLQTGAQVVITPGQYTMITATRRWVSPTQVELAYYVGDQPIGVVTSANGSIGGGTTGLLQIGCRTIAGVNGAFLVGTLDELMVLDRELCQEEVEATWLRITRYQPLGVGLFKDMIDDGFPISDVPASDVQLDIRMTGHALGLAGANTETLRNDFLPQRAYGSTLEQWERAVAVTPQPSISRSTPERRARVLARLRQRLGISIPGLEQALASLVDGAVDDLEFIAFSNQIDSDFTAIDPVRWDTEPSTAAISVVGGAASFQPGPGSFLMNGTTWPPSWVRMRQVVGGDAREAHALVKLVFTTPQSGGEAGIYFENAARRDYLLLGLRDVAGSFKVYTQSIAGGVASAAVEQATIGANPAAIWLHLYMPPAGAGILPEGFSTWKAAWSTTSATAGFTISPNITHPTTAQWSGCYVRSISALGAGPRADFDDHTLYMPFSGRPFNAYVMLDQALGFAPDKQAAASVIAAIRHAFTHATFITRPVFLAGDPDSRAGLDPTGGY